jgi:hypothetical protein
MASERWRLGRREHVCCRELVQTYNVLDGLTIIERRGIQHGVHSTHSRRDHRSKMWRNLENGDPARNVGYPPAAPSERPEKEGGRPNEV